MKEKRMVCKPTVARLLAQAQAGTVLLAEKGVKVHLVVVLVGDNPASQVYVRNKVKTCGELGIKSTHVGLPASTTTDELLAVIDGLNKDKDVHGILVQLPLPKDIDESAIISAIDPDKDVDGFHPINVGRLWLGESGLFPCTPMGVIALLEDSGIELKGKHAVVIGRSNIVGKPMLQLLLRKHCTVTVMHSRTQDPASVCGRADIVVAAVGVPGLVKGDWLKPGAVVVDVGMNTLTDEADVARFCKPGSRKAKAFAKSGRVLYGDVFYDSAVEVASLVSPVPGGVGKLTIAHLMTNCVTAAKRQVGL